MRNAGVGEAALLVPHPVLARIEEAALAILSAVGAAVRIGNCLHLQHEKEPRSSLALHIRKMKELQKQVNGTVKA